METYMSRPDDHHLSSSHHQHQQHQHEHTGFFGSVLGGAYLLFVIIPLWLWHLYIEYLWKWDEHPLIKNTAATFRLLAVLVVAPFALLTLLDVGAYVIARTLGVVETTKASTSDSKISPSGYSSVVSSETSIEQTAVYVDVDVVDVGGDPLEARQQHDAREVSTSLGFPSSPSTPSSSSSSSAAGSANSAVLKLKPRFTAEQLTIPEPNVRFSRSSQGASGDDDGPEAEARFYSPSDERQLELSGALLSSPTPSRQGSPGIERRHKLQVLQPLTPIQVPQYDDIDAAPGAGGATSDDASSPTD